VPGLNAEILLRRVFDGPRLGTLFARNAQLHVCGAQNDGWGLCWD